MNENIEIIQTQIDEIWQLLKKPIFVMEDSKISVVNILISILAIILTLKIARYLGKLVNRALANRGVDAGIRHSLEKFVRYTIISVSIVFALDNLGISLNSLAAIGAVLMVGIGFGLQNVTQNFVSGIIILIERPIKVGDIVRVGAVRGRVLDIRVRSTVIQTRDEVTIIVPNSKLVSEEVINDSYSGRRIRQHVHVGVSYSSDIDKVKALLCAAASRHNKVLPEPPPRAIFEDFGDSSLNFDLRFWCADLWEMDLVASDIRSEILNDLRVAGIEIPFPQRDLHIKGSQSLSTPQN